MNTQTNPFLSPVKEVWGELKYEEKTSTLTGDGKRLICPVNCWLVSCRGGGAGGKLAIDLGNKVCGITCMPQVEARKGEYTKWLTCVSRKHKLAVPHCCISKRQVQNHDSSDDSMCVCCNICHRDGCNGGNLSHKTW
eukprot:1144408-Pelagomonas_calceolata.AAC.1